ncbi:MAG: ABC transporter ATP-binding protein [Eubacterium sp.]|nr:ABC transporter ATP-binding protein [Eubacterium sp.]
MNPANAVEVRDITKKFKVYYDKGHTLKEKTLFRRRRAYQEHEVLKGISFEIKKGEAVGFIGHNGCGKSTTLKLLTQIMYPDSGTIEMRGRVSSLLELGAGFHPDMSGRENIYINASIFGLTRKEIEERLDAVISFSELGEFIDNPVRTYSSGMYMRLAFSVAIHVDADILLIDEILAVGDSGFQAKCFHKLREIKAGGTTIAIVSHSLDQIEQICEKSYWIHEGKIAAEGTPREVHPQYLDYIARERIAVSRQTMKTDESLQADEDPPQEQETGKKRWGNGMARIQMVRLLDEAGKEAVAFRTGRKMTIEIHYQVSQAVDDAIIGIGIFRTDGVQCYGTNTKIDHLDRFSLKRDGQIKMVFENISLLPAQYTLDLAIESGNHTAVDYCTRVKQFETFTDTNDVGVARIQHRWCLEGEMDEPHCSRLHEQAD